MRLEYVLKVKLSIFFLILISNLLFAADWYQWRGPNRDGVSGETGLLQSWPEQGPKLLWSLEELGDGFSSPSIYEGTIYLTGMVEKQGTLFALDLDGKIIWKQTYGPVWKRSYPESRSTPYVDGDAVYVISGMGKVICFDAKTGHQKWAVQAVEKFGGEYHNWGIAESPLIDGGKVFCTPGGKDASIVALDKKTGETIWTTNGLSEKASYCSPIIIVRGGKRILVTQLEKSLVGVDSETGNVLWKDSYSEYSEKPKAINPVTPIYHDNQIYVTSGYDDKGAMLELSGDGTRVTRKWTDQTLDCHHGGVVLWDGHIFGSNWYNNRDGKWVCLDWDTGKVMYETEWHSKGSVIVADGMLYCYEESRGNVGLIKATPDGFNVVGSFKVPLGKGQHWAHPVISDGRLYIRHGAALMVYDIMAK
jgi:outer membrane protein assembly factor BamB